MIEEYDYNRLIGDFVEANASIVNDEFSYKGLKIIAKLKSRYSRKRLLKACKKLRNSEYIVNCDNIHELFSYYYNNFPPEGSHGSIVRVLYSEEKNIIEGELRFDDYIVLISIDGSNNGFFDMSAKKKKSSTEEPGIHVQSRSMTSNKKVYKEFYTDINNQILNEICDYIDYTIKMYMEKR